MSSSNDLDAFQLSLPQESFLSLLDDPFDFDSLYAEISRMRPSSSQSNQYIRSPLRPPKATNPYPKRQEETSIDLRALEYVSDCETHLMCPICHVPFIDPVALSCDHYFCRTCFAEFWEGVPNTEETRCPSCRTHISPDLQSRHLRVPRLILNMCDDLMVHCPNMGCDLTLARGFVEHHATKDCEEERLQCPSFPACDKTTRRKHFVEDSCCHLFKEECVCGELVRKDDTGKHKRESCSARRAKCDRCGESVVAAKWAKDSIHDCRRSLQKCPGREFGCNAADATSMASHIADCPIARLAPFLKAQATTLSTTQIELARLKTRNEVLEDWTDRMVGLISDRVLPIVEKLQAVHVEKPRPSSASTRDGGIAGHSPTQPGESDSATSQRHLLALHESLRTNVTTLEREINAMSRGIADMDARTSMMVMNDNLRIKEDLALVNAALFSTRRQVQWLLDRERSQIGLRGRAAIPTGVDASSIVDNSVTPAWNTGILGRPAVDAGVAGPSSAAPSQRPLRRLSSVSRERDIKL